MAVGRGNAVVVATDGRRLSGDVLVGHTSEAAPLRFPCAGAPVPSAPARPAGTGGVDASGKLQRVEAYGMWRSAPRPISCVATSASTCRFRHGPSARECPGHPWSERDHRRRGGREHENRHRPRGRRPVAAGAGPAHAQRRPAPGRRPGAAASPGRRTVTDDGFAGAAGVSPASDLQAPPRRSSKRRPVGAGRSGVGKTYRKRPVVRNVSISLRRGRRSGCSAPTAPARPRPST